MFCTDDERMTCQEEKRGCKGCFYDNDKYNEKLTKNSENKEGEQKI